MGGGFLADELSGERDRRSAVREEELLRLQEDEARYRSLVEEIPVVTYVDAVDRSSSTIYISPRVEDLLGYSPSEWTADATLWSGLLHPDDREWVLAESLRTNATHEPFKAEYRLTAKDGHVVWVRDDAVLFVDLDDFKRVNDTLGHAAGDELLRQVADRLAGAVRDTDVVARHAGDEFLVLLGDLETLVEDTGTLSPLAQAERVADRIHHSLDRPFHLAGSEVMVSASIGISRFPIDADTPKDLLVKADTAMYQSKKTAPAGSVVFGANGSTEESGG
jgi:diguanylate cyclase (GGDEF)-like protein